MGVYVKNYLKGALQLINRRYLHKSNIYFFVDITIENSCHILSHHVESCHILSNLVTYCQILPDTVDPVTSHHTCFTPYLVIHCYTMWQLFTLRYTPSHTVTDCHALPYFVKTCHILSLCHTLSHLVPPCHILSHFVTPCHTLPHLITHYHTL